MGFKTFITVAGVLCMAVAIGAAAAWPWQWLSIMCVFALATIILAYKSVSKQIRSVHNGIDLLKSQDFASRLCKTGDRSADEVVTLFNKMMDALKAERLKAKEQSHFLAKLVDVSPMGIAICSFNGQIIQQNPAFKRFDTPALQMALASLKEGETQTVRNGSAQIYRCSRLWFMDSGFRRPFFLVELLTSEIALAERNVFKTIVRTIGHEVNNTLGSVKSILETMAQINTADAMVAEATESAISGCDNLVAFIKGYADVVKLPQPNLRSIHLAKLVGELRSTLLSLLPPEIALVIEEDEATEIAGDAMLLERVLINIVKNAAESIGDTPGGMITIRISNNELTVTDNGKGIVPENESKIFTPFYSTKHPDRGLGLMLVTDILRAHNADFSLSTSPSTHLTTAAIHFPAHS